MAEIEIKQPRDGINILLLDNKNKRAFLPSKNINIFPCSRRGQYEMENSVKHYDPEARLNTERTNRLHTAINGFTDSVIINNNFAVGDILTFTLAGYRIEVKDFNPADIADQEVLDISNGGTIYAHLSLHNKVSLSVEGYYTEILYRQSTVKTGVNYLDVTYTDNGTTEDFFVGISFTKEQVSDEDLPSYNLPLFSKSDNGWELVQTSLLPKVEHDTEPDSIKLSGDFTVKHDEQTSFKVIKDKTTLSNDLEVLSHATVKTSLVVGERTADDSTEAGTITAKNHIQTPTLEATASIKTPLLNATNGGEAQANIDNANITGELRVQNDGTAKLFADTATITGETVLNNLKAETTTELFGSLTVAGETTINNALKVTEKTTLKSGLEVEANGLKVTDGETELQELVAGETELKSLTVNEATTLKGVLSVTDKVTLNNGLSVTSGDTELKKTTVEGLIDIGDTNLKNLSVTDNASVIGSLTSGSVKTDSAEVSSLTVTGESTLSNVMAAEVTAKALELEGIGQVPALELAHLTADDIYQLRFKFGKSITIKEE